MTILQLAKLDPQHGDGWHVGDDHDNGDVHTAEPCDVCGATEMEAGDPCVYTFSKLGKAFCGDCLKAAAELRQRA